MIKLILAFVLVFAVCTTLPVGFAQADLDDVDQSSQTLTQNTPKTQDQPVVDFWLFREQDRVHKKKLADEWLGFYVYYNELKKPTSAELPALTEIGYLDEEGVISIDQNVVISNLLKADILQQINEERWIFLKKMAKLVKQAGERYGVDPKIITAQIWAESGFQNVEDNGNYGLMQIRLGTAWSVTRRGKVNLLDPAENIDIGAKLIRQMLDKCGQDMNCALQAYNIGEDRYFYEGIRNPKYCRKIKKFLPEDHWFRQS